MDPTSATVVLTYLGDDSGEPHVSGVPARDLTENDVVRLAEAQGITYAGLLASGIYEEAAKPKSKKAAD